MSGKAMTESLPSQLSGEAFPPIGSGGDVLRPFGENVPDGGKIADRNCADESVASIDDRQVVGGVHGIPDKVMGCFWVGHRVEAFELPPAPPQP